MVMPTKVQEMNCGTWASNGELRLYRSTQHGSADIKVVAVEEHAGAD